MAKKDFTEKFLSKFHDNLNKEMSGNNFGSGWEYGTPTFDGQDWAEGFVSTDSWDTINENLSYSVSYLRDVHFKREYALKKLDSLNGNINFTEQIGKRGIK